MKRIAFLGPKGTVSHESTAHFFKGMETELIPYSPISNVFQATLRGDADYSVIPIENTIEGSVRLHMDYLITESDLPIQAEWVYPSVQNLIGRRSESGDISTIRKIISIDVAIAQCQQFLKEKLPNVEYEYVSSTAQGIKLVKEANDPTLAAIGTRLGAAEYGLDVLAENITDHDNNYTRFVLVGPEKLDSKSADSMKTTITVTLPEDFPGALHQFLSCFAWRRINLSKIESRPTKKKLGSYYFYVDIEASLDSVLLPAALAEIEALGCQVRILGSYPTYSNCETAKSEV
jgi:prephenate dehydratase